MAKVLVTQSKLDTLAGIIGGKSSTEVPLTLDEMITAADSITSGGGAPTLQTKSETYTPTTSQQTDTITADAGYDGLGEVDITVNAVPVVVPSVDGYGTYKTVNGVRKWDYTMYADSDGASGWYDGEGTYTNVNTFNAVASGTTITPTTSSQTIGGANYMMEGAVTVSAMPTGTAGTPTATKGAVSSHSVSVTPSVTNTTGYITGSTKTGTAVSVSASELVSGTLSVSTNGQQDVTNYQYVDVNVSGGGGSLTVASATKTLTASASSISFTNLSGSPTSFVITSSADQSTGGTKSVAVAYDGTNLFGMNVTTQAENDTGFSKSYSNGTLTVTATSATFEANEYKLVYTYGGSSSDIHTADVQVGSGATSITFTSLSGKPAYFSCVFKSSFSTSSGYQRVIDVVNDGTNTYGHAFDSSAKAQTSWSYSYSGGSLTISSTGTNNGGYFHQPGYYQLTYAVDPDALNLQEKTGIGATTSSQTITADNGYDGLESVQIDPVSQTNLTAANIKSGTTISISNGSTNLWSVTGTYSGGGGYGYTLLTSEDVTANTTTTTATSLQSITISTAWTTAKMIYVRIRDKAGKRNGYFYGSDCFFINYLSANSSTNTLTNGGRIITTYNNNQWAQYASGTSGYGVYVYDINSSGRVRIYTRYNSTNSRTINGTYKVEIYSLDWPDGVSIFA